MDKFHILIIFFSIFVSVLILSSVGKSQINNLIKVEGRIYESLEKHDYVDVVVILKEYQQTQILSTLSSSEFISNNRYNDTRWFSGKISRSGLEKLSKNPLVADIHTPVIMGPALVESLPLINVNDVWLTQIYEENITGVNQVICVIDTGVNKSHPDLFGKVIKEKCFCNNGTGCCPGGLNVSDNATDETGHGTAVAGIIAANGNIKGVAPDSKIVAVRVTQSNGSSNSIDLADGIKWCKDNKDVYNISVISISIVSNEPSVGVCDNDESSIAVNNATIEGIFVSVTSGNNGNITAISIPSCASNVTSVGMVYDDIIYSTNKICWTSFDCSVSPNVCNDSAAVTDSIPCATNRNDFLDLLAPGAFINSTNLTGYVDTGGTSSAAPLVSGAAALLIQYEKLRNNRNLDPKYIENMFKNTGKIIKDNGNLMPTNGWTNLNFPRIDVYAALFPLDVLNLQRVKKQINSTVYRFDIQNNFNNKTLDDISWSFYVGHGTPITNDYNISLPPKNTSFVFFEQDYSSWDGDYYTINATATSSTEDLSDTETMTIPIGNIIAYDLEKVYNNSKEYVFKFSIYNNLDDTRIVNWTFNTGEQSVSANQQIELEPGEDSEDIMVFFHYNYTQDGEYTVNATAFNNSYSDYTNDVTVIVPS